PQSTTGIRIAVAGLPWSGFIQRSRHHPMREDVKRKHFSTALRETSIGAASRPLLLRGEGFGFNAWSAAEYDRDTDRSCWSPLEWFHAALPTPFVARQRKTTVGAKTSYN